MSEPRQSSGMIGSYRLLRKVRTGPHLEVYESVDGFERRVEVLCFNGATLRGRTSQEAFFEEVRKTASVTHENSCLMLEMGAEGDVWYVVFLVPDAPNLRSLLERGGGLDEDRVRRAARGAAAALTQLHAAGLRHSDLRPETVFLSSGKVVLGPRSLIPLELDERDPRYLAPEEIKAAETDIRADLFVLAAILEEALTGAPAFPAASPEEALERQRAAPSPLPAGVSPELASLVTALLAEDPDDRPMDPAMVARVLDGEIDLSPPPVRTAAQTAPGAPPAALPGVAPSYPGPAIPGSVPPRPDHPPPLVLTPSRSPGRLHIETPKGTMTFDLLRESVWLGLGTDDVPLVSREEDAASVARLEAMDEGYVLQSIPDREPKLRVNGSLVDRHVLVDEDRIRLGEREIRYESLPPDVKPAPTRERIRRTGDVRVALATALVCAVVVAQAVIRWGDVSEVGKEDVRNFEEVVQQADATEFRRPAHTGTGDGWPGPAAPTGDEATERRNAAAKEAALARAFREMVNDVGVRLEEDSLYEAYLQYKNFSRDHPDTRFGDRARGAAADLLELVRFRFQEDQARVEQLMQSRDFALVLPVLDQIDIYGSPRMRADGRGWREEIQRLLHETQIPEGPDAPPLPGPEEPGPGPGDGPGDGPPDPGPDPGAEKLETRAEAAFEAAAKAVRRQRWPDAVKQLEKLRSAPLNTTEFAKGREPEIARMYGLSNLEVTGVAALFHGEVKMGRGRQITIRYTFKTAAEEEDWTFFNPFADPQTGRFDHEGDAMHGRGVGALAHSAVFEPETLVMKARLRAVVPHDLGLVFFEPEHMIRFYLFTIQNRYFTIGAERKPLHENVIWIFGGGSWADTPKAEIGFIRVAKSPNPPVTADEWLELEGAKKGDRLTMTLKRAVLNGSAMGDDRYEYPALRPGLYILRSEAVVDEVTITGVLDKGWTEGAMKRARDRYR